MISITVSIIIVTDGQTNRHGTTTSTTLYIALRGKNVVDPWWVHFGTQVDCTRVLAVDFPLSHPDFLHQCTMVYAETDGQTADRHQVYVRFPGPPNKKHETFLAFMILMSVWRVCKITWSYNSRSRNVITEVCSWKPGGITSLPLFWLRAEFNSHSVSLEMVPPHSHLFPKCTYWSSLRVL